MIWYRHWLELRYWSLAVACFTLLAVANAAFVMFVNAKPYDAAWLTKEWPHFAHLLPQMGPVGFLLFVYHAAACGFLTMFSSIVLAGRTGGGAPTYPHYYAWSLPVPRAHWIWSRWAVTVAIVVGANLALLLTQFGLAMATGRSAPWTALASASLAATIAGIAFVSLIQLSRWISAWWIGLAAWAPLFATPAYADRFALWSPLTVALAVAGLGAALITPWIAGRRDY